MNLNPSTTTTIKVNELIRDAVERLSQHFKLAPVSCGYELRVTETEQLVIQTDIAQRIAAAAHISDREVISQAGQLLSTNNSAAAWATTDRFINIIPNYSNTEASESITWTDDSSLDLPTRVLAIKPQTLDATPRRLAARVGLQMFALRQLGAAQSKFQWVTVNELSALADAQASKSLSTVWVFPHAAPRPVLSEILRRLGGPERVLLESITSDEWGPVEGVQAGVPLSPGQILALGSSGLPGDVDLLGAGRNEVDNLPWLARTVSERMAKIFQSPVALPVATALKDHPHAGILANIRRDLGLANLVLRCAARGKITTYLAYWKHIIRGVLRIINDPQIRIAVATGQVAAADFSCSQHIMSVLSESALAWEKKLQEEPIHL